MTKNVPTEDGAITRRSANVWKDTWVKIAVQLFVIHSVWTVEVALLPECAAALQDFRAATAKEVSQFAIFERIFSEYFTYLQRACLAKLQL